MPMSMTSTLEALPPWLPFATLAPALFLPVFHTSWRSNAPCHTHAARTTLLSWGATANGLGGIWVGADAHFSRADKRANWPLQQPTLQLPALGSAGFRSPGLPSFLALRPSSVAVCPCALLERLAPPRTPCAHHSRILGGRPQASLKPLPCSTASGRSGLRHLGQQPGTQSQPSTASSDVHAAVYLAEPLQTPLPVVLR